MSGFETLLYDFAATTEEMTLPLEFNPIQSLLIFHDPYAMSRKWFVYDDDENEERYNEDW